eukprot:gb/GECH01012287.1/.p1 GENE.gb/GECH01012287.1/~~gb/GECH01012287.1/.p1  ORF type:complete len:407 (+),score=90.75 gb/GECH01012287.1/:1-1221(+)
MAKTTRIKTVYDDLSPTLQKALGGSPRGSRTPSPSSPSSVFLLCYLCGHHFSFKKIEPHISACGKEWEKDHDHPLFHTPTPQIPENPWDERAIERYNREATRVFKLLLENQTNSPSSSQLHEASEVSSRPSSAPAGSPIRPKLDLDSPVKEKKELSSIFSKIPIPVVIILTSPYLTISELLSLRVNKQAEKIISGNKIWQRLCDRDYNIEQKGDYPKSWKDLYFEIKSWQDLNKKQKLRFFEIGYSYQMVYISTISRSNNVKGICGMRVDFLKKNLLDQSNQKRISIQAGVKIPKRGKEESDETVHRYMFKKNEVVKSVHVSKDKKSGIPLKVKISTDQKDIDLGKYPEDESPKVTVFESNRGFEIAGFWVTGVINNKRSKGNDSIDKVDTLKVFQRQVPYDHIPK